MKKQLFSAQGLAVAVCRYAPGERHALHTDAHSRISFLLRGGYREESRPGAIRMGPGDVLLKARTAEHEDVFGADGAVIVALEFLDRDPFDAAPRYWRRRADGFALRHATAFLEAALAGDAAAVGAAGADILCAEVEPRAVPPRWLEHLKDDLEQASLAVIDVAARAHAAGAHVAHVSRLFRRCYGASITEYAQVHSVRRAVAALAAPDIPLREVALDAGFYDQSHMSRVFRRVTGRTPGAHRALFSAAC